MNHKKMKKDDLCVVSSSTHSDLKKINHDDCVVFMPLLHPCCSFVSSFYSLETTQNIIINTIFHYFILHVLPTLRYKSI